jgi:hypothetical protein
MACHPTTLKASSTGLGSVMIGRFNSDLSDTADLLGANSSKIERRCSRDPASLA